MYTLIRDGDGSVTYRTRKSPAEMTAEQARRALSGLLPLLQELLDAGYPDGRPESVPSDEGDLVIPGSDRLSGGHPVRSPNGSAETDESGSRPQEAAPP